MKVGIRVGVDVADVARVGNNTPTIRNMRGNWPLSGGESICTPYMLRNQPGVPGTHHVEALQGTLRFVVCDQPLT